MPLLEEARPETAARGSHAPVVAPEPDGRRRESREDVLAALSWANLCFLRIWSVLLTRSGAERFYLHGARPASEYLAVILDVLVFAALFYWALRSIRRGVRPPGNWFAAAVLAVAWLVLCLVLQTLLQLEVFAANWSNPVAPLRVRDALLLPGVALLAVVLWKRRLRVWRLLSCVLAILSPLVLATFGGSIFAVTQPPHLRDSAPASRLPVAPHGPRVVWIIFDEWDYRLTFAARDSGLQLPEFDRLRRESIFATQAFPPGNDTHVSIPALLSGHNLSSAKPSGESHLDIEIEGDSHARDLASVPSVFSRARDAGFNPAAAGWYLPYCRVYGNLLADCSWSEIGMPANSLGSSFLSMFWNGLRAPLETSTLSPFGYTLASRKHIEIYRAVTTAALRLASDRGLGMVFLHMPAPHAPFIYDRASGDFTRKTAVGGAYSDALALADKTLGDLRRAMESSGVWDSSTVLVSSDHWFRKSTARHGRRDHRVPFLLKLAGQHEGAEFHPSFNTVLSQELIVQVLRGSVVSPESALRWLARQSRCAPRSRIEQNAGPSAAP